ncbi:general secretion pathway protein E [Roseateles asaccharophilus]|uniref:GspE/PulE family protein n=1 Tax=Roseateles asaccharophilus TaxID=582607 RepID=UPI003837A7D4
MTFFTRLLNLGVTKPHARPAPRARQTPLAIRGTANGGATVTKLPSAQPRTPAQPKIPTFQSTSDLPPYASIASAPGGSIELTPQMRQHLFILALSDAPNTYCIGVNREHYGSALYQGVVQKIQQAGGSIKISGYSDSALITKLNRGSSDEMAAEEDKPIMREIDKLVMDAMAEDVSDVHIESRGEGAKVRFRIHGRMVVRSDSWDADYVMRMARAMHTMADDESKPSTFVTDASLSITRELPNNARVKLRVQLSPAYPDGAIDIVIRVLRVEAKAKIRSLVELGYAADHISMLEYMLSSPHGLIVIAGETGSGKTTTLQTAMHGIWSASKGALKMISVEDPPEYILEGVTQIPAKRRGEDNPFLEPMRHALRMDPDVVMIGEVRDQQTANLMTGMVTSGHKALTTIHTESAPGIIGRLRSMGVDADILAARGFLSGLVYQTLIPTLCEHCRVEWESSPELMASPLGRRVARVSKPGDTLFMEGPGCSHCKGTGIAGRTVCAEMLIPDDEIRHCILNNNREGIFQHWKSLRDDADEESMMGRTALDHAIQKMRRGLVSPAAVESDLGLLYDFTRDQDLDAEPSQLLGLHG